MRCRPSWKSSAAHGHGLAAVARVTEDRWVACAVRDEIASACGPAASSRSRPRSATRSATAARPSSSITSPRTRTTAATRRPHVRLSELHLDADLPPGRAVLRHALRHRPRAARAEDAGDDRQVPDVRRPDRLPPGSPGAPGPQRGGAARRAAGRGAARAVHRRARPRSAQPAGAIDSGTRLLANTALDDRATTIVSLIRESVGRMRA